MSFKLKKLFVDGRTDGRTDIFPSILLGRLSEVDLKTTKTVQISFHVEYPWAISVTQQLKCRSMSVLQIHRAATVVLKNVSKQQHPINYF